MKQGNKSALARRLHGRVLLLRAVHEHGLKWKEKTKVDQRLLIRQLSALNFTKIVFSKLIIGFLARNTMELDKRDHFANAF